MFVGLPSAGLFTSSIVALSLGCLEDDSLGVDAENVVSALPKLLRCVVQAVDTLPAEVSPWVSLKQYAPATAVRGEEPCAHTSTYHVLMMSATLS